MRKPWFDESGFLQKRIPKACIADCTHMGDCLDDVRFWQKKLEFMAPRNLMISYLREFGAWPLESDEYDVGLNDMTDDELAEKCLWIACCDLSEGLYFIGLIH